MSKRTTIRIPDDLYSDLLKIAHAEQRTVSNLVIRLLRESIKNLRFDSGIDSLGNKEAPGADASKAS